MFLGYTQIPAGAIFAADYNQNIPIETERSPADVEIDDGSDAEFAFFASPLGNFQPQLSRVSWNNSLNNPQSFFTEVPTPPPLKS
jgi:hypothetical protein